MSRDLKRARRDDGDFSHSWSDGGNHSHGKGGSDKCGPRVRSVGEYMRVNF